MKVKATINIHNDYLEVDLPDKLLETIENTYDDDEYDKLTDKIVMIILEKFFDELKKNPRRLAIDDVYWQSAKIKTVDVEWD